MDNDGASICRSRTWLQFNKSRKETNSDSSRAFDSELKASLVVSKRTLEKLSKQYKIHLMPSSKKMLETGRKVIEVIENQLSDIVSIFKFNLDPFNTLAWGGAICPKS